MNDKTIVITGASDGIGAAAARELHKQGARVVLVGRSEQKTKAIADELGVPYYIADYAKLDDVRELARKLLTDLPKIDVLANNAGALIGERTITGDGHEMTYQVNHLAPFLLTSLMMNRLIESKATIINTSSFGHRLANTFTINELDTPIKYKALKIYGTSKLLNILFTRQLHARYHDRGIATAAFHPGIVRTGFSADSGGLTGFFYKTFLNKFFLSPEQGADTLVWLATASRSEWQSGEYYVKRTLTKTTDQANDKQLAVDVWNESQRIIGLGE